MDAIPRPGAWTFEDADVARQFDAHVREQLPWYDLVTRGVVHVARHYVHDGALVYDVGASTGNVGRALAPVLEARRARLVSIEPSAEMAKLWRGPGELVVGNAETAEWRPHALAVFFLVLMFVPVDERRALLERVHASTAPGGAIVVVDRCVAARGYPATVLWRLTLQEKLDAGASPDQIVAKELSLEGVQRPMDPSILPGEPVEWFRFGDFAAWIVEKNQ